MAAEIAEKNNKAQQVLEKTKAFLAVWQYDVAALCELDENFRKQVLRTWIYQECKEHVSEKLLDQLAGLLFKANNWTSDIGKRYCMSKEYGIVHIHV